MSDYTFKPFRFWCQKVLPLVYDDSLSYYELLCKLVKYLNDMLAQLETMGDDITNLQALYVELKNYVDHYFDSEDFEQMVSDKLDEMAEDGTLAELINNVLFNELNEKIDGITATARICFVPSGLNKVGNCAFIYDNHTAFVIDCGNNTSGTELLSALQHCGVTRIMGIAISHWHNDHVNGFEALVDNTINIDTSACTLYSPHHNLNWASMIGDFTSIQGVAADDEAMVIAKGGDVVYPTEGQKITVFGGELSFHNLSNTYFADYYDVKTLENDAEGDKTNYNNFSMVCKYTIGGQTVVFPADIMPAAQVHMVPVIADADLLNIEHHGLNYTTYQKYLNGIKASIFVVSTYGGGAGRAMNMKYPTIDRGYSLGAVYKTELNQLIFEVGNGAINLIEGTPMNAPEFNNVLSIGQCIGPEEDHGDDFDNYVIPGIYAIPSGIYFERMDNRPSGLSGGGKLLVSAGTNLGAITQYYLASSSTTAPICIRCMDYDGTWHRWNTLFGGTYRLGAVDADWWVADVTPTATQAACRLDNFNGTATLDLRFTLNENLAADADIMIIPTQMSYARTIYFPMFDDDGNLYPCRLYPTTDGIHVYCMKALTAETELMGSVSWLLNPAYGWEG